MVSRRRVTAPVAEVRTTFATEMGTLERLHRCQKCLGLRVQHRCGEWSFGGPLLLAESAPAVRSLLPTTAGKRFSKEIPLFRPACFQSVAAVFTGPNWLLWAQLAAFHAANNAATINLIYAAAMQHTQIEYLISAT